MKGRIWPYEGLARRIGSLKLRLERFCARVICGIRIPYSKTGTSVIPNQDALPDRETRNELKLYFGDELNDDHEISRIMINNGIVNYVFVIDGIEKPYPSKYFDPPQKCIRWRAVIAALTVILTFLTAALTFGDQAYQIVSSQNSETNKELTTTTQESDNQVTKNIDTPTPSPTPPTQAQIGIAPLGDICEKSARDLKSAISIPNQDIEIQIVESIVENSEEARQLAQNQDFILMIWGTCTAPSQLDLHFEIMTKNTPPLVFDLQSLSVETSARDMSEAGDISEALIYYSLGGADNYAKAADLLDILTLKSEQLVFIKGNARLFQGFDHYNEALTAFEEIEDDTDLHSQTLNNLGVTYFNLAVGYDLRDEYDDLDTSLDEAHKYFEQAIEATQDADLLSTIRVNQARLFYTYPGDDEEGDFQRALDICQDEESAPAYICRVAAAYQRQDLDPVERCNPLPDVQHWLDDLQQAENLDPNEAEPNYWRFRVKGFRLSCTEPQAIQDALRNEANNDLEEFRNQTNARIALLEIDKYYLRAQPISND